MLVSIDTTECFFLGGIGERYIFRKEWDSQHENPVSMESSLNKVMETIMVDKVDQPTQNQIGNVTDEHSLMELFNQLSGLTPLVWDWLELDTTVVISKASLQGKKTPLTR